MKKFLLLSLSALLFSCSNSNTISQDLSLENSSVDIQSSKESDKNVFESYVFYYGKPVVSTDSQYVYDKTGLSELLVQVKSLTGSLKFNNQKDSLRYFYYEPGASDSDFKTGSVRLGKDGKIYFENKIDSTDDHTLGDKVYYEYYLLGSYDKTNLKNTDSIKVKLNSGINIKFKGQGLNPMADSHIQIKTSTKIKPVEKLFKDFY